MTETAGAVNRNQFAPLEPGGRFASIDAFRGLTILIMVFVNDVAGVKGIPGWMKHAGTFDDTMTFVDVVFPAFLFIVGMSIPFALSRRIERGASFPSLLLHIFMRTLGLLIVGVFMVNMPADSAATGMDAYLWKLLVFICVIVVWNQYPRSWKWFGYCAKVIGLAGLAYLAYRYRGKADGNIVWMRTQWWGILGLIGWAYLVAASLWLILRKQIAGLMGMLGMLTALFIGAQSGAFKPIARLSEYIDIGSTLGSQPSITVAGIIVSMLFFANSPATTGRARLRWILTFAAGLTIAGFWLRPLYGISKNMATPAWCLICSAISCVIFALLYWIMDLHYWRRWAAFLRPAGENPLLAYILPSIIGSILHLWPSNPLPKCASAGTAGIACSAGFAFIVLGITWLLGKLGVRLRL